MKRIKNKMPILAAILGVALAFGTSSFTTKKMNDRDTRNFQLINQADENSRTARLDPSSWEYASSGTATCAGGTHICQIVAVDNGGTPDISGDLETILDNNGSDDVPDADNMNLFNKPTP